MPHVSAIEAALAGGGAVPGGDGDGLAAPEPNHMADGLGAGLPLDEKQFAPVVIAGSAERDDDLERKDDVAI